jgi:hypothetical protein
MSTTLGNYSMKSSPLARTNCATCLCCSAASRPRYSTLCQTGGRIEKLPYTRRQCWNSASSAIIRERGLQNIFQNCGLVHIIKRKAPITNGTAVRAGEAGARVHASLFRPKGRLTLRPCHTEPIKVRSAAYGVWGRQNAGRFKEHRQAIAPNNARVSIISGPPASASAEVDNCLTHLPWGLDQSAAGPCRFPRPAAQSPHVLLGAARVAHQKY